MSEHDSPSLTEQRFPTGYVENVPGMEDVQVIELPGEGETMLWPLEHQRDAIGEDFNDSELPKLIERIESGGGIAELNDFDYDPELPTLFAIVGPSGVGKTTILDELASVHP